MSRLTWDGVAERLYETGTDRGVVYPTQTDGTYGKGAAWNGLTSVSENPSGADANDLYADNIKYLSLRATEDFGATVEAYTYPDEFADCDGSREAAPGVRVTQQVRKPFGMSYRTLVGNDVQGTDFGYKIHLVYGATVNPSSKQYQTVNNSPEAITFSWEMTTTPVNVTNFKPTAHLEIDSTKVDADKLTALEDIIYGTAETEPRLPLPDEVIGKFLTTTGTGDTTTGTGN